MEEEKKNPSFAKAMAGKSKIAESEEKTLEFWRENNIFEKSLKQTENNEPYIFYDGPPFATGIAHYGHLLQSVLKDAVPRYATMKGQYVRRVWGWDCHGLPIENLIEKELGLEHKKDIETYGVEKFNQAAKDSVLRYDADWKKIIPRFGRWIDMENSYKTMDWKYTESVWWAFKTLFDKGLIYEGYKPMHICPRCETTLAASEVSMNYQNVKDLSVTAKFELVDEPGTFVLAWTTTPWTLPGNVALAVGKGISYVKATRKKQQEKRETDGVRLKEGETYILAKERLGDVLKDEEYEIIEEFAGETLLGKSYKPLFDYYANDKKLPQRKNGWKIYNADFVTTETGTGVVHIAPAFGEDDMELGKKEILPFVQHVGMDGIFKHEVFDFEGMSVKPKSSDEKTRLGTDIAVIKYLQDHGTFFSKEKIEHSYPLCWRCDTPLLNYATSSWFVKVTAIKDEMIQANSEIRWVPETMKDGRFGKWLEGARDWAISRSRYWGAPIPVWKCQKCDKVKVVGSLAALHQDTKLHNRYLVMRHGEADSNATNTVSSRVENPTHLTEKGRKQVEETAEDLKGEKFDFVFASDFMRTKETVEIMAEKFKISPDKIIFDPRLREIDTGEYDGKSVEEYHRQFANFMERFTKRSPCGENIHDVRKRAMDFLFETDQKMEGKNILIVTHEYVLWMLDTTTKGLSDKETYDIRMNTEGYARNAGVMEITFSSYPHGSDYEINLHRPYIDDIVLSCDCGGEMKRVPEVFDCWFESGSMPYAQFHYPFENEKEFEHNFPANFIAEAVDQTRGWFYNMLVLSVGLFGRSSFQNVVTTGLVLSEDGKQKLSKKLKNYPDPSYVMNQYGADSLRYYLLSAPIVHGEDLKFSEKGVDEIYKKIIVRLQNVVAFYELYAGPASAQAMAGKDKKEELVFPKSAHILDEWIFARLGEVRVEVENAMEKYELDRAVRPISLFVDDLSTWYLQNSRERLKGKEGSDADSVTAREILRYVLFEFAKIIAPFTPFVAEEVYQKVKPFGAAQGKESVHLESWSTLETLKDDPILALMNETRKIVSLGLEARAKGALKVRQPLKKITLKAELKPLFAVPIGKEFLALIADRVNVKDVSFDKISEDVLLDTEITAELKEEGTLREFIRNVQELRKKEELNPNDREQTLLVSTDESGQKFLKKFKKEIQKATLFSEMEFTEIENGTKAGTDEFSVTIAVKKGVKARQG
ncbi:MAG: class I tRNA ligase family protein [Candidatus Parcubacteria bacterium]|nr:class I tRNA ligase family protein [Candidatus Parcubacteria bacterium]